MEYKKHINLLGKVIREEQLNLEHEMLLICLCWDIQLG